jgi:hypothetical protein
MKDNNETISNEKKQNYAVESVGSPRDKEGKSDSDSSGQGEKPIEEPVFVTRDGDGKSDSDSSGQGEKPLKESSIF